MSLAGDARGPYTGTGPHRRSRMVVRDEDARQREAACLQRQQNRRGITGIDHEGPFRACLE